MICSRLYWHERVQDLLPSWGNIKNTIFDLQSTDIGPEILRRNYVKHETNNLNKLAILLCVLSGTSWSHLITHRLLQKDMDFIKTMLFLSQSLRQSYLFKFQINTHLFNLIRNDAVEEFIAYINRNNISSNANITGIPLIAIACLFGSKQIFNYLRFNNADLTSDLWFFAVAGHNAELIHLLEENHVSIENLENLLILSRSLGYQDIFGYLVNQYQSKATKQNEYQNCLCKEAFLTRIFDPDSTDPMASLWHEFDFRYLQGISAIEYNDLQKLKEESRDQQSGYHVDDYANQILVVTEVPKDVSLNELKREYPNIILIRYQGDTFVNVVTLSENSSVLQNTPLTLNQACDLINFDGFSVFVKKLLHDVKSKETSIYYPYASSVQ